MTDEVWVSERHDALRQMHYRRMGSHERVTISDKAIKQLFSGLDIGDWLSGKAGLSISPSVALMDLLPMLQHTDPAPESLEVVWLQSPQPAATNRDKRLRECEVVIFLEPGMGGSRREEMESAAKLRYRTALVSEIAWRRLKVEDKANQTTANKHNTTYHKLINASTTPIYGWHYAAVYTNLANVAEEMVATLQPDKPIKPF